MDWARLSAINKFWNRGNKALATGCTDFNLSKQFVDQFHMAHLYHIVPYIEVNKYKKTLYFLQHICTWIIFPSRSDKHTKNKFKKNTQTQLSQDVNHHLKQKLQRTKPRLDLPVFFYLASLAAPKRWLSRECHIGYLGSWLNLNLG